MRRRSYRRHIFVGIMVFAAVFAFVFSSHRFGNGEEEAQAANLVNFDPGYIMSDYQMSNYASMTEAEIQAWLTTKNPCANTDYDYYLWLSSSSSTVTWHWANGHFVCISEELFGDGEVIGTGETAAHIIWQAAQDYHINPQVLLVLLQKENSLITDEVPNNWDYRTAAGYGCPDTAACSSKYYGFKNQVRNAAALFHEVLSGGWTNYPLGENYIRYSPHCDSGTVVNIRSLATSALYRYTPYQPNAAVLAAGYGVVPGDACAAYGNRNFYSFFEDWFGSTTSSSTITEYYKQNGGTTGLFGNNLNTEVCGLAKSGCYQAFENGYIYWSPGTGAHGIYGDIFSRWFKRGTEWGVLGYPKSDIETLDGGVLRQQYENGYIYWTEEAGAWDISGGILAKWKELGSESSWLGYPTSGEQKNEAGMIYQTFEHGVIYWDVKTGAWVLSDFASARWEALRGFNSKLGQVLGNGVCGLVKNGCYQPFKTGNIYYTEETGAWDVSGGIYETYLKYGTEWGSLGYPTSGEQKNEAGMIYQTFEHGVIYWDVTTGASVEITD